MKIVLIISVVKQGYIKESYEMLICLPNKVVIKIEDKDNVDTIVK